MKEKFKLYLAGACQGLPDNGTGWRKEAEDYFNRQMEFAIGDEFDVEVYNPTFFFPRGKCNPKSNKQVKNFYLKHIIQNCDAILVNLNNSISSVGTGQELQYAVDHEIPIIGFGKENVYEWLPDDCDVVFDTLEEAMRYIIEFYIIE